MKLNSTIRRMLFLFFGICFLCLSPYTMQAATVYVFSAGNNDSDAAVREALETGGHEVTLGVQIHTWNGTQADLDDFDAVVILNSFNFGSGATPPAGRFALTKYLCDGGGIVTGEWFNYYITANRNPGLEGHMPVTVPTFNGATSTTYRQETEDSVLNDGLPPSFTLTLENISGSESSFDAKAGATVFYISSNGGGRVNSPGVVGWTSLNGKVLSFSTLITQTELRTDSYQRLLSNAVNWVARPAK